MTRWKLVVTIVVALLFTAPLATTASAAWFVHPKQGFKVWYPDDWYLVPWIPGVQETFRVRDISEDDPRFGGGRDLAPRGAAGIWLELHTPEEPCRKVLERHIDAPLEFATWEEKILGGRKYLLVRDPGHFSVVHLACWSDESRQYLFWLDVNPPHPRYKEVVATWEKVIASLELPPANNPTPKSSPTP